VTESGKPNTDLVVLPREGDIRDELALLDAAKYPRYARFVLAALGSIPWIGGLIGASASIYAEHDQGKVNSLQRQWLEEHAVRLHDLGDAINEITGRLDQFGDDAKQRIESDEYLGLVRQAFRAWDEAATKEKRRLLQQLLANAGGTSITSDDVVRLFIDWIEQYHEAHFAVIRVVYQNPGSTRAEIWESIHGSQPREDSAEADLFKLLVRDLTTGSVIRQHRETNYAGQFVKKTPTRGSGSGSSMMKSAFDDKEPYELTELGKQFVHYTMSEIVPRMASPTDAAKAGGMDQGADGRPSVATT
jgi:hypothetical protein